MPSLAIVISESGFKIMYSSASAWLRGKTVSEPFTSTEDVASVVFLFVQPDAASISTAISNTIVYFVIMLCIFIYVTSKLIWCLKDRMVLYVLSVSYTHLTLLTKRI